MKEKVAQICALTLTAISMTFLEGCRETQTLRKEHTVSEPSHFAMDYKNHMRDIWFGRDTTTFHSSTKIPSK